MSKPARNAFKGYSFQGLVYSYFAVKMDIEREIINLEVEVNVEINNPHNFDDIKICTNNNNYYCQVKNYTKSEIRIENDKVYFNGKQLVNKSDAENILIVLGDPQYESNEEIFGLPAYYCANTHIVSLAKDKIFDEFDKCYEGDEKRFLLISKIIEVSKCNEFVIKLSQMPPLSLYEHKLEDVTIKVRSTECFDINAFKGVVHIIGKPGVGKSHFVEEHLKAYKKYRFWIAEADGQKQERLIYNNFVKEIGRKVSGLPKIISEKEIIDIMINENILIVIDGLDHVENYAPNELNKVVQFISNANQCGGNVVVLSRPLKAVMPIDWEKYELPNWTKHESQVYMKEKYGINDYKIQNKIYKSTNGYPILINFVAQEYLDSGKIEEVKYTGVEEYYSKILDEDAGLYLSLYNYTRHYFTIEELKNILGVQYEYLENYIKNKPYLFNNDNGRISLIHDSMNLYLKNKYGLKEDIGKLLYADIQYSLTNYESRYLCRIHDIEVNAEISELINNLYNLNSLDKLINNSIDFESLITFYSNKRHVENNNLCVDELYQYTLMRTIYTQIKNNLSQNSKFMYQLYMYLKANKIDWNIYSSGELWKFFTARKREEVLSVEKLVSHRNDYEISMDKSIELSINEEKKYFAYHKNISNEINIDFISRDNDELTKKSELIDYLASIYMLGKNDSKYYNTVDCIINDKDSEYTKSSISNILTDLNIRQFFLEGVLASIKNILFQNGFSREKNPYVTLELGDYIDANADDSSEEVISKVTAYLRLANKEQRKIKNTEISKLFSRYYTYKNYSLYTCHKALYVFVSNSMISVESSIKLLVNIIDKSSGDGTGNIIDEFLMMFNYSTRLDIIIDHYDLIAKNISIDGFGVEILDKLNENQIFDNYEMLLCNSSKMVDYNSVTNLLESKHGQNIIKMMVMFGVKLKNVPQCNKKRFGVIVENYNVETYNKEDEIFYGTRNELPKDKFVYETDLENINKWGIGCVDLAKRTDGFYYKLPFPEFFLECNDMNLGCIPAIIKESILYDTQGYGEEYDFSYTNFLGNIPWLVYLVDRDYDMKIIYNSFVKYMGMIGFHISDPSSGEIQ